MLAKSYLYPYECIESNQRVYKDKGKAIEAVLCDKGKCYPLYNSERTIDRMNQIKQIITTELDELQHSQKRGLTRVDLEKSKAIADKVRKGFEDMEIKLIVESGYKELFQIDLTGESPFVFDLESITKVYNGHLYSQGVHLLHYNNEVWNLADLYPQYFKAHWRMQ